MLVLLSQEQPKPGRMDDRQRYLSTLGLDPSATTGQVREAYRDLVKVWHPDRFEHDPRLRQKAQERLKEINEAIVDRGRTRCPHFRGDTR